MHCRSDCVALAMFVVVGLASPARAEGTAESLFNEGRELLRIGKTAEACDKFATSVQMFEAGGVPKLTVAAMINHADCREQNQQLATAWSMFLSTAALAQNHGLSTVASEARKRAGLLQPRLSMLTILVPDASRIDGLEIARAGQPVDTSRWNQGIPLDGGSYVVTAKAPQNAEWSATIQLPAEGGNVTVEIPRLKQLTDLAPSNTAATATSVVATPASVDSRDGFTALHWSGIGVASVGGLGLGASVYFALRAKRISNEVSDAGTFMPERVEKGQAAERSSLIAVGVGSACVIAGGLLFYLGYRSTRGEESAIAFAPVVWSEGAGFATAGRF